MPGLFGTQEVAGAPNFQIPHGDFEAGTEFRKVPDGRESFFSNLCQGFIGPISEIGIGMPGGTSHPSPKLVELAQTEPVGIFDNQGVGVGNVQTGFDDSGAYQNLNISVCHGVHHIAEGGFRHLSVGDPYGDIRDSPLDGRGALVNGLHLIVEVIHLTAPLYLPADGIIQNGGAVLQHIGLNRIAVGGRLFNGGHIPDS